MTGNIEHPEPHRQSRLVAGTKDESMTDATIGACMGRTSSKATINELLAIANAAAAHVVRPYISHAELLYDENGLP